MIVNCPKCGKEFDNIGKWSIRKFCSRPCANSKTWDEKHKESLSKKMTGMWRGNPVEMNKCGCCDNPVQRGRTYCSPQCSGKARRGIERSLEVKETLSEKAYERGRGKRFCLQCQILLKKSQKSFCSFKCNHDYRFINVHIPLYLCGKSGRDVIRKALEHFKGYKCEECQNNGVHNTKLLVLDVDHIDGNSDNNMPENLRFLCPNCHSQTDTWKAKNKNTGFFTKRSVYMKKWYDDKTSKSATG